MRVGDAMIGMDKRISMRRVPVHWDSLVALVLELGPGMDEVRKARAGATIIGTFPVRENILGSRSRRRRRYRQARRGMTCRGTRSGHGGNIG